MVGFLLSKYEFKHMSQIAKYIYTILEVALFAYLYTYRSRMEFDKRCEYRQYLSRYSPVGSNETTLDGWWLRHDFNSFVYYIALSIGIQVTVMLIISAILRIFGASWGFVRYMVLVLSLIEVIKWIVYFLTI